MTETINISSSTIVRTILIVLFFVFLFLAREIIVILFAALIIASGMVRPVNWMQKRKIPRILGVIISYLLLLLIVILILYLVLPPLASEVRSLSVNLPSLAKKIQSGFLFFQDLIDPSDIRSNTEFLNQVSDKLAQATSSIFNATVIIFGGFFTFLAVMALSIYLTFQEKGLKHFIVSLVPAKHQVYASRLIDRSQARIGAWVAGQIVLGVIIAVLVYAGLKILGVKYALVLAIISGMLEVIPYLGPILSAVIAAFFALIQSPILALWVIVLFWIIQQAENYLIVPQVMQKAVGLNPLVVIVSILVGAKLAGFIGVILAVPAAAILAEVLRDLQKT